MEEILNSDYMAESDCVRRSSEVQILPFFMQSLISFNPIFNGKEGTRPQFTRSFPAISAAGVLEWTCP